MTHARPIRDRTDRKPSWEGAVAKSAYDGAAPRRVKNEMRPSQAASGSKTLATSKQSGQKRAKRRR